MKLKRSKLEQLIDPIVKRCKKPMERAIKDAKLKKGDIDNIILVGGPTRMPIIQKFVEDFMGKKPEKTIDPMECVAMGAAIQGAVLAGEIKDLVLLDVTPLTLGIETLGGVMTPLIERNTTIPTKKNKIFSTAADFQTAVTIHVLQGERPMASDNTSLGQFNLVGIPPAPRGVPQIDVTFDIDANGILNVSAKDLGTGKEQKITITASTKLSKDEIDKMVKEAEKHAEEDTKRKEIIETKNEADSLIYTTESTMNQFKDKIDDKLREKIEESLKKLKETVKSDDIEKIKKDMEELRKSVQEIGAQVYQQAQTEQMKTEGKEEKKESKKKDDEKVVDAEYEVEKDDKKK